VKPLSLRTQLTLIYTTVFGILLVVLGGILYHTLANRLDRGLNDELDERAAALRGYLAIRDGIPQLVFNEEDAEEAHFIHDATRFYQVFDVASGELVVQSRDIELLGIRLSPEEVRQLARNPAFSEIQTRHARIRFHNYVIHNGSAGGFLIQVGSSLQPVEDALEQFLGTMLLLIPVGALLAALCGWWMARRAIRPVDVLARAAREIEISGLHRRLPTRGTGDEIDRLSEAFNETLAKLQASVEQMKQFTAAISHELRTPLTALRGQAEVALLEPPSPEEYRGILADQLEEFDKLTRMINHLLTLARADAGEIRIARGTVDLSELVNSLVEQMEPVAASENVELEIAAEKDLTVVGDRDWLERAVLNLLDNAIKFTPANGRVVLTLGREDQMARLEVRDTGIGIPSDSLPHIFDRFYRADPSRSRHVEGAGLGLSLVKWIVEQHDGRIAVESAPASGTCFTVSLPLAGPSVNMP
jgi:two-component system OmpR family sensor kinase